MKAKENELNLYYMNHEKKPKEDIEELMKRKKAKEREIRIQENKNKREEIDLETEAVIQMTNRNKIRQEEEKRKNIITKERKIKKRNKKIKRILKIVISLSIIIGGITFAMISPVFNIVQIQIENQTKVINDETIISLSQLKLGDNIFRFNSSDVINKIKENAYIENVKIHRKIPNIVQIEIEERTHIYSVDFLGKYAYINKKGYVLEIAEDTKQKPVIQGITTPEEEVIVGKQLGTDDLDRLEDVIKIMNVTKEYELDTKVTNINVSNKNEYDIYFEEEKKKVHLGDSTNLSNKMLYVNAIVKEEKGKSGDIFVNGDLNNKFQPYFRENLNV